MASKPDVAVFHDLRALLNILDKDLAAAAKSYQQAIEVNPKDTLAYLGIAKLAMAENKLEQAKEYAEKGLAVNDKALQAYFILADVALKQKNLLEVENILITALEKVKGNIPAELKTLKNLGKYYASQKKPEKILAISEELSNRYPKNNNVISALVAAQLANNQKDQAEQNLRRIIDRDKQDIKNRLLLASLLSQQAGKEKDALALMDEAAKINPDQPQANYLKATYLIQLDRTQDAMEIADKLDAQFPTLPLGKLLQGKAYIADKKLDKATAAYKKAYQLQANNRILFTLANLLNIQGKSEEAINMLNEALLKKPNNLSLHYRLATIYQSQNDTKLAESHYRIILDQQPDNVLALNNLAWMYAQQRNTKALGLAEKAYTKAPKSAAIADTYGYILLQQGRPVDSLAILKEAAALAPKAIDIKYHLAEAYDANGNKQKAAEILEAIVNSEQDFAEKKKQSNY
nr:tetratricopeptide repeat protein [Methylomarinum sp. Ch1-1]MDP4521240.1 tetratricopeptide repeat protein [Methylomarinum sp. Ch1-1]